MFGFTYLDGTRAAVRARLRQTDEQVGTFFWTVAESNSSRYRVGDTLQTMDGEEYLLPDGVEVVLEVG